MTSAQTTTHQDAVDFLISDHHDVEELFRRIELSDDAGARDDLVAEVSRELSVHTTVEEQVLYPAVRQALPDGDAVIEEAIAEHREVRQALSEIERAEGLARDVLVERLTANVRHHVDEEEGELFRRLRATMGADELRGLGARLADAKSVLADGD